VQTEAAILWNVKEDWSVEPVELDPPKEHEVLVRIAAAGLCHSDEHIVTGDLRAAYPIVGGHEGAGIVEEVGPGVTSCKPGDHCVLSFIPSCGRCLPCVTGNTNLCDNGIDIMRGPQRDGTYRFHARGQGIGQFSMLGTFAPYTVVPEPSVIVVDDDLPLDKAALVGCGVTTGWGSAVYAGDVRPGNVVAVMGVGGVGINAVQGARIAGAETIVAIDPVAFKREQAEALGATHTVSSVEEARELLATLTRGRMANQAIITTDLTKDEYVPQALSLVGKNGRVVVTAVGQLTPGNIVMSTNEITFWQKQIVGSLFGSANPRADIPMLLSLYRSGKLKLDELITRTYPLAEINQGYQDMRDGKNVRGMVVYP
jgi:S-(hydroxymethyl)glutathione dehydrogenase/alcohol dehydrogenase